MLRRVSVDHVLICGRCGGPLPRPEPGAHFVTCRFCEATTDLDTSEHQASGAAARFVSVRERFAAELEAFEKAFTEGLARGEAVIPAFRGAAESAMPALADADTLTNVVFGIAADFHRRTGADVTADPAAMQRIAIAYLDSLRELATNAESSINLPFLSETKEGPLHFMQDVTMARLRELAATPATVPEPPPPAALPATPEPPAAAPAPDPPEPPAARKAWWKRILG